MDKKLFVNLLLKAQDGDKNAFEALCKNSEQFLRSYFSFRFKDKNIVDDLCQETYMRLLKSYKNIEEPLKYKEFVLKTAFYVVHDFFRRKFRPNNIKNYPDNWQESLAPIVQENPDEQHAHLMDLKKAMGKLPEKSQYILQLQSEGYMYKEIAAKLGVSQSAIKMQIKRSLEKLNELLSM